MLVANNFFHFFNSHKRLFTTTLPNRLPPDMGSFTFKTSLLNIIRLQTLITNPYFGINRAKNTGVARRAFAANRFSIYGIYSDFTHIYASKMPYISSHSTLVLM